MKTIRLAYGLFAYVLFLATFLYTVGFVGGFIVPKAIDDGPDGAPATAILVNLVLMTLFALQHSIMARPGFKAMWTRIVPPAIERSTFVLLASLALCLLFWQWQPLPGLVWSMPSGVGHAAMTALFWAGWAIVLLSTFMISHFELFGLTQIYSDWTGRTMAPMAFRTPLLYRLVRHPIYLGFILAFWASPAMSTGHLLFAVVTTAYILVGIKLEERDLVHVFGSTYVDYRERVGMLLPRIGPRRAGSEESEARKAATGKAGANPVLGR